VTQSDTTTSPTPAPEPSEAAAPTEQAPAPPAAAPVAPPTPQPRPASTAPSKGGGHWGTGRRKTSVARVRLASGSGKIVINKRDLEAYFTELQDRNDVLAPLEATKTLGNYDVHVNVHGGGHTGQAGAVRLGVARALVAVDERFEPTLRDRGYLTRDARVVERKKPGRRKARRSFQFSKR
jgi:small subunit ribosomal protein S9